jgi:hypothetical protein
LLFLFGVKHVTHRHRADSDAPDIK